MLGIYLFWIYKAVAFPLLHVTRLFGRYTVYGFDEQGNGNRLSHVK